MSENPTPSAEIDARRIRWLAAAEVVRGAVLSRADGRVLDGVQGAVVSVFVPDRVCDHPGIDHDSPGSYCWACPACGVCKFIGHGPLCWECYSASVTPPVLTEGEAAWLDPPGTPKSDNLERREPTICSAGTRVTSPALTHPEEDK